MRTPLKSIAMAAIRPLPILLILLILLTGAIGVQTFTSCGRGGGDVKLLESIADDKGNLERKFEYDKQNRLVKIYYYSEGKIYSTKTITYADNLITTEEKGNVENLVIKGNTVTLYKETFIINEEGYIAKRESDGSTYLTYQYQNGNLILVTWEESAYTSGYKYDDKKSPFSNCTSPKWLLQHLDLVNVYASKNNVIGTSHEGGASESKYEYDSDGFPTKHTETDVEVYDGSEKLTRITRFTYRGKGGGAPAEQRTEQAKPEPAAEAQAAAKPDTLYITETGYVKIWIQSDDYVDETGDGTFYMGNALGKVGELGLEGVSAGKNSYVSFALAGGKQHVIKANDYSYDILLYKKGHEPIRLDLGSEMPITNEVYEYLGYPATRDSRDGNMYKTVKIGTQTWMAENLNYETSNSWCYDNSVDNCNKYGRLYDWNTAMKACPEGWHLPTDEEWNILVNYAGGKETAGKKLKSKSGWNDWEDVRNDNVIKKGNGTDDFGFSALPGGSRNRNGDAIIPFFSYDGSFGGWWSATDYNENFVHARYLGSEYDDIDKIGYHKGDGYSVRCLKRLKENKQ